MRLFIAAVPPRDVRDRLAGEILALRETGAEGRFVRREDLHMTLAFLGEQPEERASAARRAMESVPRESFAAEIGPWDRFRGGRAGDVLIRPVEGGAALRTLQSALAEALVKNGFSPEDRPFRPHLTAARRFRGTAGALPVENLRFFVREIVLFASVPENGRREYVPLHVTSLSGGEERP